MYISEVWKTEKFSFKCKPSVYPQLNLYEKIDLLRILDKPRGYIVWTDKFPSWQRS